MSQFNPPPDLPPQAPPGPAPTQAPAQDVRFEFVEQLLDERARGGRSLADQLLAAPASQLEAMRGQASDRAVEQALKGFAAVDHLLQSLSQAKTDADPVPPV